MKKFYYLLFLLIVLTTVGTFAQVSNYGFSSTSGTYTEISGGTQLGSGTIDDNSYNANNIGFTFNYNGTPYTQFSANANGFLAMGASVTSSYSALSTGTSNNVIAPFNADLQGNTGATLRYELSGSSPNQILTIQWKDFRHYSATSESYNFQVKLYETTDKIEVIYGTIVKNATNRTKQVGLRGASNADFNNRTTTTDWAASTAGGSNSASMTLTQTVYPASGLTYTWSPPVALDMGALALATPVINVYGNYSSTETVTIKIKNYGSATIDFSVNNVTVNSSVSGTNPQSFGAVVLNSGTLVTGATQDVVVAASYDMSAYGTYTFNASTTVTGDGNAGNDAMSAAPRTHVTPISSFPFTEGFEGTFPPTNWANPSGLWTKGSETHSGTGCARVPYNHKISASLISPPIALPSGYRLKFWWKDDDITTKIALHDTTYLELSTNAGASWNQLAILAAGAVMTNYVEETQNLSAYGGNTIYLRWRDESDSTFSAYGTGVDDVLIEPIPTCPEPSALTATNITVNSADLGWTENGSATKWDIELGPFGFTPTGTPTANDVTSNPYTYGSLSAATQYSFYVRADCGVKEDTSPWIGPFSFTTACGAVTLPYAQSFDGTTFAPACWTLINNGTGNQWTRATSGMYLGAGVMRYAYNSTNPADAWAFTPAITMENGKKYYISFFQNTAGGTTYPEKLKVTIGNAATVAAQTTTLWDNAGGSNLTNTEYIQRIVEYNCTADGDYYFAFNCYSDADMFWLFVDEVSIYPQPAVDLAFTQFYQNTGLPSPKPGENFVNYNVTLSKKGVVDGEFPLLQLNENANGVRSTEDNLTVVLPNSNVTNHTEALANIGIKAQVSNFGINAASYDINWDVSGVAQTQYNGPSVSPAGNHVADLTFTPASTGTFLTSGSIVVTGDAIASNNNNSFRMRVYPEVFDRTIYDNGTNTVDTYVGWGSSTIRMKAGVRFTAPAQAIKILGVDFICRTETVVSGIFSIQIRAAGTTTAPGAVLYTQEYNASDYFSSAGDYMYFPFGNDAPTIAGGSDYWITIKAPLGVLYPGAAQELTTGRSFYESNTDTTVWNAFTLDLPPVTEFVWVMRSVHKLAAKTLNLTALIEGFFDGSNMVADTVTVELHNASTPYALVDQAKVVLNSSGNATANFLSAADAVDYYIVVKHRNSIETWSKLPQQFTGGTLSYDFTSAVTQAYGNNLKLKSGKYCIYSGDVNGSGTINVSDINAVFAASNLGLTGYVVTDVNGSNTVNVTDINITYANSNLGVSVQKPTVLSTGKEVNPVGQTSTNEIE